MGKNDNANFADVDQLVLYDDEVWGSILTIIRQNAEIQDLQNQLKAASKDHLTGVANRRAFDQQILDDHASAETFYAFFFIDIDNFKRVNDTYGHDAGDQVLIGFAEAIKEKRRTTDIVGRWGGDEFAMFLPNCSEDNAVVLAEEIRRNIERRSFNFTDTKGQPIKITASIGIAIYNPLSPEHMLNIVKRADQAVYKSKEAGKNRVSLSDGNGGFTVIEPGSFSSRSSGLRDILPRQTSIPFPGPGITV